MSVEIPEGVKKYKQGPFTYVQKVLSSSYSPEKKYNLDRKINIGRVTSNDISKMHPNDNYFKYYSVEEVEYLETPNEFSDCLSIGNFLAFDKIVKSLELDDLLSNLLGNKSELLKSLVLYFIDSQKHVGQLFSKWLYKNYAYLTKKPSEGTISNLYNHDITDTIIIDFLCSWTRQASNFNFLEKIIISLDSTSINTSTSNVDLAEYGHSKGNECLPQINICYAINQDTGLPLFYDIYPGSINDQTQLELIVAKAHAYGFSNITLVMDRGYYCKKNIEFIENGNYDYIFMAKTYTKRLQDFFTAHKDEIKENPYYFLDQSNTYGMKKKTKVFEEMSRENYVYFFYSDEKSYVEKKNYNDKVIAFKKSLANVEKLNEGIAHTYKNYLEFETNDKNEILDISINKETQLKALQSAGFFMLVSNLDLDINILLETYKKRDIIEKTFRMLKSNLGNEKYYTNQPASIHAKTFATFIAAILRAQLKYLCKPYLNKHSNQTVNTILADLSKIEVTRINDVYQRRYALTARQKEILKCLGITEAEISEKVVEIKQKII